jgi:hypothetical protein
MYRYFIIIVAALAGGLSSYCIMRAALFLEALFTVRTALYWQIGDVVSWLFAFAGLLAGGLYAAEQTK